MSDVSPQNSQSNPTTNVVNEWLSVEAAALRMGISSRSIARRIQNGQLESRVDANGRRSVLVCLPAPDSANSEHAPPQAVKANPSHEGSLEPGQARELAQQAMTIVIRSHEETMLSARAEMIAARRSSQRAWAAVAILVVGASVTVGIVTHNLTAAAAMVRQAQQQVDQAHAQVADLTAERDRLRDQMVQAKISQAQAQGQLAAMIIKPTTQPTSAAQRFASVLFGE